MVRPALKATGRINFATALCYAVSVCNEPASQPARPPPIPSPQSVAVLASSQQPFCAALSSSPFSSSSSCINQIASRLVTGDDTVAAVAAAPAASVLATSAEDLGGMAPHWVFLYQRLSAEGDRRVRGLDRKPPFAGVPQLSVHCCAHLRAVLHRAISGFLFCVRLLSRVM